MVSLIGQVLYGFVSKRLFDSVFDSVASLEVRPVAAQFIEAVCCGKGTSTRWQQIAYVP